MKVDNSIFTVDMLANTGNTEHKPPKKNTLYQSLSQ